LKDDIEVILGIIKPREREEELK